MENGKYLFRVSAINDNGQSEPLTAENPIIAKMPYGMFIDSYNDIYMYIYPFLFTYS
jgi:hypothetical protein